MARLITTDDFLSAYSRGEIGSGEAMRGVGVDDWRSFLNAVVTNGYHLPRDQGEITRRQIADVKPILEARLRELGELPADRNTDHAKDIKDPDS
ncbi:hypothetical protein ACEUZ9_000465 [Paracoccus litorisediminis]|uniref:hypothetical protein n=1 Tax=Paracoccus litorisediminis TaxID=2006130 RepID=UPI00373112C0